MKSKTGCCLITFVLLALLGTASLVLHCLRSNRPRDWKFSGAVEDGGEPSGLHGAYRDTIAFTPDGSHVAYIWIDGSYRYLPSSGSRGQRLTLHENMELRVRSVKGNSARTAVNLDSVDLGSEGAPYLGLQAQVHPGPDSRFIAALCSRRLSILELGSKTQRTIAYSGEFFGSFSWLSGEEVAFSTTTGDALVFWHAKLAELPGKRTEIFRDKFHGHSFEGPPPRLLHHWWSPQGRYVTFFASTEHGVPDNLMLDVRTGRVQRYPFPLNDQCWKPDDSRVLVNDRLTKPRAIYLLDPATGRISDLSADFQREFGADFAVTIVSSQWTADGKHVILYSNEGSTAIHRGCVVGLEPFRVKYSQDKILRRSPFADWVLVQGGNAFSWLNYMDHSTAPISGWVNDWIWSSDGSVAAKIDGGVVQVFEPELP